MTHSTQFDLPSSLSVDLHNDIAVLSLSRPEKRNAIDFAMIRGLDRFFSELSDRFFSELSDSIRAVVIHGKGDHFSAGLDLSSISDIDSSAVLFCSQAWHRVFDRIVHVNVPVIALLLGAVVCG
jgi:(methylthio)acryloyl-CoA hydratase